MLTAWRSGIVPSRWYEWKYTISTRGLHAYKTNFYPQAQDLSIAIGRAFIIYGAALHGTQEWTALGTAHTERPDS